MYAVRDIRLFVLEFIYTFSRPPYRVSGKSGSVLFLYTSKIKYATMKNIITILFAVFFAAIAHAQTAKSDIITKMNGEEASGKVTEIGETAVKFIYDGETLVYGINKSDILKITFGSGRVEYFNKQTPANTMDNRNRVAILPFSYLIDKLDAGEAMTYQVQSEAFTFLKKNSTTYDIQDPTTTNALLAKAGVNAGNMRGFTMTELCHILGVEFVITGSIRQDKTTASTYQSGSSSYDNKSKNTSVTPSGRGNNTSSGSAYSSSSTTATQSYQTNMTMNVFNDSGKNLYSESHNSFWAVTNAYVTTLHFLLKKTPFFQK